MIENLQKHIENVIDNAFERLQYAYNNNKETEAKPSSDNPKSRLVFPCYSNNKQTSYSNNKQTRISEQELRFCFVEAFNKYCDDNNLPLFYSIETPTIDKYSEFSKTKNNPNPEPKQNDKGRSGEFDMVIYYFDENNKKIERKCLIEFKANNASELDHKKDFVKLSNIKEGDDGVLRFFIEILESYDDATIANICDKIASKNDITVFICYSLKTNENISDKFK